MKAVAVVGMAIKLAAIVLGGGGEPCYVTHYGTESDGFLGQHHGAYWHGDSCGLPDVVDDIHYGIAASRWIPYCSKVAICVNDKCVVAVVIDRMRDDVKDGMPRVDVWPVVAGVLGIVDDGVAVGRMSVIIKR